MEFHIDNRDDSYIQGCDDTYSTTPLLMLQGTCYLHLQGKIIFRI
jgi:hypothetical protein